MFPALSSSARVISPPGHPRRITPNLFGISFGLAGLAQAWTEAGRLSPTPTAVADAFWLIAGAAWLITLALYLRSIFTDGRTRTELADPTFGPFVAVPAIVGMLLTGGLEPVARGSAVVLYTASLTATLVLAGRLLAIWILDGTPSTKWHPGYYLPSVGAPLVASAEAATLGYRSLAVVLFGFGVISWILIGAVLLAQLVGGQRLPKPLIPTMAILIAPPLVAGNAWFAIDGGRVDRIALALAGYALLMAIVQLGLVPLYRTVPFGPGWWSYSFPAAALIGNAIAWLAAEHAQHQDAWIYLLLAVLTAFIGYLAARTVVAAAHRSLLPGPDRSTIANGLRAA